MSTPIVDNQSAWPARVPVVQIRLARPVTNLDEIKMFYHKGLGLPIVGSFENHSGYSGLMIGLPNADYHLEFTAHDVATKVTQAHKPDADNLLVLYLGDEEVVARVVIRLGSLGYFPVPAPHPHWESLGVVLCDPAGYHLVLSQAPANPRLDTTDTPSLNGAKS